VPVREAGLKYTKDDLGVGIRQQVRRHLQDGSISSTDAIRWALQEGHSTKTGSQPGGLGLKLLKEFITRNGGRIQIVSRMGFFELAGEKETLRMMAGDLPGTTVNIEINTADSSACTLHDWIAPKLKEGRKVLLDFEGVETVKELERMLK
jgi:hypothetical protein